MATQARRFDVRGEDLRPADLTEIAARVKSGGLIIYPTDTLYALGCLALHAAALVDLRAAKGREGDKPLSVIAADEEQAKSLASSWPPAARSLAGVFWPGPLTLVLPAALSLPRELLGGARGVAVRVPDSRVARSLAAACGPLVSTSANLSGEPPCRTVDLALAAIPAAAIAIDAGPLDGLPSTFVDVLEAGSPPRILREGRVPAAEVGRILGEVEAPARERGR